MDKNLNDAYARIDAELSVGEKRTPFRVTAGVCIAAGAGIWYLILSAIF